MNRGKNLYQLQEVILHLEPQMNLQKNQEKKQKKIIKKRRMNKDYTKEKKPVSRKSLQRSEKVDGEVK